MDPTLASKLGHTRDQYKTQLATALREDADPLAAYDAFVKWTIDNYNTHLAESGLLELLEEATRHFVDDDGYKSDLRYLKLWLLYASHVEDPIVIYMYLLSKGIGTAYAQLYQECADELERRGKRSEAAAIYKSGIQRRARPTDPLKRRYADFRSRTSTPPPKSSTIAWQNASSDTRVLLRNPLKYHPSALAQSVDPDPAYNPYALMLAPPPPDKRKEKLMFNLSLLFTEDGVEYSTQEARARSMGLLGKKWGPPPKPERSGRVTFSGDTGKSTNAHSRKSAAFADPTVTLATKEALADVYGMYNSPEKSMRFGPAAGSKHAPVKRIEPMSFQSFGALGNDNDLSSSSKASTAFRPFVDENAGRTPKTPADVFKIIPFVDPDTTLKPKTTPKVGRPALHPKEAPARSLSGKSDENAVKKLIVHVDKDESKPPPVFSLTPGSTFRDRPQEDTKGSAAKFTPFADEKAPKVFSMPTPNASAPTFTPLGDRSKHPFASSGRLVLGERTPSQSVFTPPQIEPSPEPTPEAEPATDTEEIEQDSEPEPEYDLELEPETPTTDSDMDGNSQYELERTDSRDAFTSESSEDADDFDANADFNQTALPIDGAEDSMFEDDEDEADKTGEYHPPLGGRFGQFNVMTPITERTFEYTSSTRGTGTPGFSVHRDAVEAAEQLAAELREDDDDDSDAIYIEEKTGTLSLADALDVASSFKPPNPCNPFDAPITSTLLMLITPDTGFHDLRNNEANQLEQLEKFAKKKTRRSSGNSTKSLHDGETLPLRIHDREFVVLDKLGEGGFGAVFEAIDLNSSTQKSDGEDEDEDEDAEDINKVALKVVKPRNLWEYHVLRRIHGTLSTSLRRSIISAQALYAFRDESFLILELRKQGTLLDIVNRAPAAGITQQGACLDELLVMFFTVELMRLLEGMHRAGFIHGDMKIDNCLVRLEDVPGPASAWDSMYRPSGAGGWAHKGVKLIDFGRTIDTRLFPSGQRYVSDWPTDARDCFEMREGRPWTFQPDYFGLAGTVYCMLYGKYIEAASVVPVSAPAAAGRSARFKLSTPFKRYWQGELWARLFDALLNPTLVRDDGKLPITDELAPLREEMERWLQANCNRASNSLKGLLKKVGLAVLGGKDGR